MLSMYIVEHTAHLENVRLRFIGSQPKIPHTHKHNTSAVVFREVARSDFIVIVSK